MFCPRVRTTSDLMARHRTDPVDGSVLRTVMRRCAAPVTVVTAAGPGERRGITIGSFTSVSLDPPLVCFNVQREATMHELVTTAPHFAVHLLRDDQAHLSERFAVPDLPGEAQFEGVAHRLSEAGVPLIDGVLAVLRCVPFAVYPAGDHSIVVGEVVGIDEGEGQAPLLYFDRRYHTVGDERRSILFSPVNEGSSETS